MDIFNKIDSKNSLVTWSRHFVKIIDWLLLTRKYIDKSEVPEDIKQFWSRIITFIPYGSGGQRHVSGWARILFPGSKYDAIPEEISLLETIEQSSKRDSSDSWRLYTAWIKLDEPEGTTQIEAELNDNAKITDVYITAGHIGFAVDGSYVVPKLGYYIHALPKEKADITASEVDL